MVGSVRMGPDSPTARSISTVNKEQDHIPDLNVVCLYSESYKPYSIPF